jgi:hypothetical protein
LIEAAGGNGEAKMFEGEIIDGESTRGVSELVACNVDMVVTRGGRVGVTICALVVAVAVVLRDRRMLADVEDDLNTLREDSSGAGECKTVESEFAVVSSLSL